MNKKLLLSATLPLLIFTSSAHAFDFSKFLENVFSKKAGYKAPAVSMEEQKNLEKFEKNNCSKINPWGSPIPYNKDKNPETGSLFICRDVYNIRYDEKLKVPLWASYILRRDSYNRPDWRFLTKIKYGGNKNDPDLPEKILPNLKDYAGSGYVAHNLVPIIDNYSYNSSLTEEEDLLENQNRINQAYYSTNTFPVAQGLDKALLQFEAETNKLLKSYDYQDIMVVSGLIYINGGKGRIGKNGPVIPSHIFKIYANSVTQGTTVYVIPNDNSCANGCNFNSYVTSFKEVERLTGLNIFSSLAPVHAAKIKLDPSEYKKVLK